MYGIVYRDFLEDGRSYVGQTILKFEKRKIAHKTIANKRPKYHFHKAINVHGFDNFKWEILQECVDRNDLNASEIYWINFYDSIKSGFNECAGGRQSGMSEKARLKLSEDRKGDGNPNYGKSTSARGKGALYAENIPTKFKDGHIPWNKGIKSGHKRKLNFQKAEEIREMYRNGVLIREICEKYGIKSNTVFSVVKNDIWTRNFEGEKKLVIEKYEQGLKGPQISKETGICIDRIYKYLKEVREK